MRRRTSNNGESAGRLQETTTGRPVFSAEVREVSGHEDAARQAARTLTEALRQACTLVAAQQAADGRHAAQARRRRSRQVVEPRRAVPEPHKQLRTRGLVSALPRNARRWTGCANAALLNCLPRSPAAVAQRRTCEPTSRSCSCNRPSSTGTVKQRGASAGAADMRRLRRGARG